MPTNKLLLALLAALLLVPVAHAAPPQRLPATVSGASQTPAAVAPAPRAVPDWSTLTPAQQRELRTQYATWRALDESERQRVRHAAAAFAALPGGYPARPAERQRVRHAAAAFAALPGDRRSALQVQFRNQDRLYRDGWRLGPRLGAAWPKLQPLLGYLPDGQRGPMLALLRQLDEKQLQQLVLLSQRTPPQDRERVRAGLLATTAANRDAWLQAQVVR